jgi:hypothetical protein
MVETASSKPITGTVATALAVLGPGQSRPDFMAAHLRVAEWQPRAALGSVVRRLNRAHHRIGCELRLVVRLAARFGP